MGLLCQKCFLVAKPPPKELFSTPFHPLPQRWLFQNWQSSFHLTRWEKTSSLPSSWLRTLGPLRHEQTVERDWGENYKETNDMLQQSKSTFKGGTLREYLGGTGPSTDLKPKRENLEMKLQEKKCSCSSLSKL